MTEPFGLSRGTIRSVIAGVLAVGLIPVCIFAPSEGLTGYVGIAGFVLRDYFAMRAEQNRRDGPPLSEPAEG